MIKKDQIKNYIKCLYSDAQAHGIVFDVNYALKELKELSTFISCLSCDITPYPYANSIIVKNCYNAYVTSKFVAYNSECENTKCTYAHSKADFWKMMSCIIIECYDWPEDTKAEIQSIIDCVKISSAYKL